MRVLWRLVLGGLGLLLAVPAGAVALAVCALADPVLRDLAAALGMAGTGLLFDGMSSGLPAETALGLAHALVAALLVLVALPPSVAALAGETFGLRSVAWYGGVSGALTAGLPWLVRSGTGPALAAEAHVTALLFVAGGVAGTVYWFVAGRSAGAEPYSASPNVRPGKPAASK